MPISSRPFFALALASLLLVRNPAMAQDPSAPSSTGTTGGKIDNTALIPKLLPDDQVQVEGFSPDWMKTLIMTEVRVETATSQGTLDAATSLLDHYAEMGVNGLWVTPIWDHASSNNGYVNRGPDAIDPKLTGTDNAAEALPDVKRFVDEAHRRNIRILFDIIVWGTRADSHLVTEHPEYYSRDKRGNFTKVYGGYAFDWGNAGLKKWYCDTCVNFIEQTGADGFRVDLAPDTSSYYFKQVRDALYAQGHKIAIMSETPNERKDTFDFEENGVNALAEEPDYGNKKHFAEQQKKYGKHNQFLLRTNIVDDVTTGQGIGKPALVQKGEGGQFRYYTSNLLNHDDNEPFVQGNRVRFGYVGIFSPFIPLWWMGEEYNDPKVMMQGGTGVMYFNVMNWDLCQTGDTGAFYEDCKKYIQIRRSYPDLFQAFPDSTRQANIAKVDVQHDGAANNLQAYARFAGGKAILVVPNYQAASSASTNFDITPPYAALGLSASGPCTVTDLMSGQVVYQGSASNGAPLHTTIQPDYLGVYLVEQK